MNKHQSIPFLVRPEPLLSRAHCSPQNHQSHRLTCKKGSTSLHGYISSSPKPKQKANSVNWMKYNIIVSIYDNWLRLAPFIRHLLEGKNEDRTQPATSISFQRNKKSRAIQGVTDNLRGQFSAEVQKMIKRRKELKQKNPVSAGISWDKDTSGIRKLVEMSKQIINSLPAQNKSWTKAKIHKHNQIIDDCLQTYNQEEFNRNFDTIVTSLKDRLRFIEAMQTTFLNSCEKEQEKLNQKIEMLKKPFNIIKKEAGKEHQERCEVLLKALEKHKDDHSPAESKLKKKAVGRHTVYKLNFKEFSRESDEAKKNNTQNVSRFHEKSMFNNSQGMQQINSLSSNQEEGVSQLSQTSSSNDSITSIKLKKGKGSGACNSVSKSKIYNKDYFSNLLRGKYQKREVQKQNSFTLNCDSKSEIPKTSMASMLSDSDPKLKKQAFFVPSIDEIDEQEIEHHFNKLKSHKKVGTMKFINGNNRRGRQTKDSLLSKPQYRQSNFKLQKKVSNLTKTQPPRRKDFFQNRKGNLLKKGGVHHKTLDFQASLEECINWQGLDWLTRKEKVIQFLKTVQGRGWLNDQKHSELKGRVEQLLNKCSPAVMANNRRYAKQMEELSLPKDHHQLPKTELGCKIKEFLLDLHGRIQKDKMISLKIKNQLQLLFDPSIALKNREDDLGNEKYFLHSYQFGNLKDQIRRVQNFKEEGERFSLGRQLLTAFESLQQRQL